MLRLYVVLPVMVLAWGGWVETAAAFESTNERNEFQHTHFALSIERFMGVDYTDFEGPGGGDLSARLLLNASEPVPTSYARAGFDLFIERFSVGVAAGVTSKEVGIVAPRIGYLFGLTRTLGVWLRAGGFYASAGPHYLGIYAEALLEWFPYSYFALHLGPTLDVAFANKPNPNYIALGIPELGMTAWF